MLFLCASVIGASSRCAHGAGNAETACRIVTQAPAVAAQATEQSILSDQVVDEVDNVVQVFNQLANVAKTTAVAAAASSSRTTSKPVAPTGAIAGGAAIYRSTCI